jgi:CDP-diacylglycerol--glycerol-3-phosphate 3-phosphatidyltransferase
MTVRQSTERLLRRHRLLDAARGMLGGRGGGDEPKRQPLKCFCLQSDHFGSLSSTADQPPTPTDFHSNLCDMIRGAKRRVYLASLYVGPAASSHHTKELELLDALSHISSSDDDSSQQVDVKVLLDKNRALRPVPMTCKETDEKITTSSAQAVAHAIQNSAKDTSGLYLFQVLSSPLKMVLPNPLDEVAGVFHIKAYIIDDSLILSGANLSEEYFSDRQDRYLWICNGGNGLVDFYADLIDLLCNNSEQYANDGSTAKSTITKEELLTQLTNIFTDSDPKSAGDLLSDNETVGVCIPTFQAPGGFFSGLSFPSDVEATNNLLDEGSNQKVDRAEVKLASAYLNPPQSLLDRLANYQHVDLLSAGRVSHGFRPKKKAGNKGKDWIPTVFEHLAQDACQKLPQAQLLHWEREDWTFHSKGLWLEQDSELVAAIAGSGNFGARSHYRDMESNCIFVFPPASDDDDDDSSSPWQASLHSEWKVARESATPVDASKLLQSSPPLPTHIRFLMPYIKSFF